MERVMNDLKGKAAIVTGGSRGIGRALVLMLAREGCDVAFNYAQNASAATALVEEAAAYGVRCRARQVDVRDFEAVKSWVAEAKEAFGRLDILINNAGIIKDKPFLMMTPDEWHAVIDTNLNGMFNAARTCVFTFLKQRSGVIVNISSISGIIGLPGQTNYSASKGGMNAFTKALAKEAAPYNVRVNAVAPGFIETDMLVGMPEDIRAKLVAQVPLGRVGSVEDVCGCVRFLISDDAAYMTGHIIQVDGGLAIR